MDLKPLLFFLFCMTVGSCLAQVQVNPYVGLATGSRSLTVILPTDPTEVYRGDRWLFGVDVLLGRRRLAPLGGLLYHPSVYRLEDGDREFTHSRLHFPLGVAYRLLPADLDLNLVLSGAVAPGIVLGDDSVSGTSIDKGLVWAARAGAMLYLDGVTLGAHFLQDLANRSPYSANRSQWAISIGYRF